MSLYDSRSRFNRKLASIVLLVCALSFLFPFILLRENRISTDIPKNFFEIGFLPALILLIFPVLICIFPLIRHQTKSEIELSLSGVLGSLSLLGVLGFVGSTELSSAGAFARYSPGIGMYVYITAIAIIYLMKPRMLISDYVGIVIIIIVGIMMGMKGLFNQLGIVLEAKNFGTRLTQEILAHIRITSISLSISIILGLPIALLAFQSKGFKKIIFPLLNVLQTIPGIALFGLLIAPLAALSQAFPQLRAWGIKGIGNTPAIIALSMYALYPIIRYSFTAFTSIDDTVILAAKGMGMNSTHLWRIVRIPLATPQILHGIRVALVQTIGNATLAKLIGGDGLGVLVFEGLGQASVDMVLLGMLLIIGLTVIADRIFQIFITLLTPVPLRTLGG